MKRYFVVTGFLLLVMFLTACGGGEEVPVTPESPTEPPPAPTSLPPAATSPPPTATTLPEPTNTAVPVMEPTATAVSEPAEAAPEAAAEGEAASGSPQSACDNPWLPIREGAVWTYDSSVSDLVWTVTSVEGDLANATAQMQADVSTAQGTVVLNYTWECTPEGMASFDLATLAIPVAEFDMTLTADSMSGQFLLPAEQMTVGAAWDFVVVMNVSGAMPDGTAVSGTATHTQNVQVIGDDPVTIDGVTVDGLQIQRDSTIEINMSVAGVTVPVPPTTMNQMQTMARGIGITEMSTTTSITGTETQTLVSWSVP